MKRGQPPKRRTPLKRSHTALKRTRLKRQGRKAEREQPALDAFKAEVHQRAWCEVGRLVASPRTREVVCGMRTPHAGTEAHHVWPEDRDAGLHDPERGLLLCRRAHWFAHNHPNIASSLGLLRPDQEAM